MMKKSANLPFSSLSNLKQILPLSVILLLGLVRTDNPTWNYDQHGKDWKDPFCV